MTALLAMLNSCATGVAVVNIDNGFGAAAVASKHHPQSVDGAAGLRWSGRSLDRPWDPLDFFPARARVRSSPRRPCGPGVHASGTGAGAGARAGRRSGHGAPAAGRHRRSRRLRDRRRQPRPRRARRPRRQPAADLDRRRARWRRSPCSASRGFSTPCSRRRRRCRAPTAIAATATPAASPRSPRSRAARRHLRREVAAIRRAILPSGDIADNASPALRDIRDALRRQRAKLRSTLEGLTRDAAKYLQDQIVTDRNGRYVVVVRAEHRGAVPGIVHGTSGSGASLYLEPLATVELNNDVVALTEREREEIHRILLGLTNALRRRQDELDATRRDRVGARRTAREGAIRGAARRRGTGRRPGRRRRVPRRASSAVIRRERHAPVPSRSHGDAADERPRHFGTEHRRQDRRAQGVRPARAHGAVGAVHPGRGRQPVRPVPVDLRGHRRRAVDRRQPQHVLGARRESRRDGARARPAGARAAGRSRRRHRPVRRRRARRGRHRSLPAPRRDRHRDDPRRCAEVVRGDDVRRAQRGLRIRSRDVRADLPAALRRARPQPGPRRSRRASACPPR